MKDTKDQAIPHFQKKSSYMTAKLEETEAPAKVQMPFNEIARGTWLNLEGTNKQGKKMIAGIDQDELVDPELLADPDSCFSVFNGVNIHHKIYDDAPPSLPLPLQEHSLESKKVKSPMVLLHGFAASVFSWSRVMKPLAESSGSKVLAFDRPAFGLTERVNTLEQIPSCGTKDVNKSLNPYSMTYSVLSTLFCINLLGAEKAVLVGHSLGALVAVNTYLKAPERVAALVLVAPAILAPYSAGRVARKSCSEKDYQIFRLSILLSSTSKYVVEAVVRLLKWIGGVLAAILRSTFGLMLVRMAMDKFGIAALKFAWHDQSRVSDHILRGYTQPLRCKQWDRGLVEFAAALLDNTEVEPKHPLAKQLGEISCPVLIVTGDHDHIVPSWNAERLSKVIPGSVLEVIKHCGHIPHEEKAEEFVSAVEGFLQTAGVSAGRKFWSVS